MITPFKLPLRPIFTISPSFTGLVGSPTKQKSSFIFFISSHSTTFLVPKKASPSSSAVSKNEIDPLNFEFLSFKNFITAQT